MSLLFDIPADVLIHVLSQWCEVNDLGFLDTAFCSVKRRSYLLKIFCSNGFDLQASVTLRGMQFCADKEIAMKSIVLSQRDFDANCHRNFLIDRLNTQKVTELQILKNDSHKYSNDTTTFCYQFANQCYSLEKLMLIGYASHVDMFVSFLSTSILHNLKVFSSNHNYFGVESYKYLAEHCKCLEVVSINYNLPDTTELDIQSLLINNYSSLKSILLYYDHSESNLTNKTFQCVIDHCPKIEQLYLGFHNKVLVSLSLVNQLLTKCTALTDFRIGSYSSQISLLNYKDESLIVMRNPLITNEHELLHFFTQAKQNKVIQLSTVPLLNTTTLDTIAHYNLTSLEDLNIFNCKRITTADVLTLINSLPKLTELRVSHCPLVDQQEVEEHLDNRKKDGTNKEILYKNQ